MAQDMNVYRPLDMSAQAPIVMPKLPSISDALGRGATSADATPDSIFKLLQTPQGRMTDVLPSIQELLLGNNAPAIASIREGARGNRASAQSDAMKRGLTGSDIEAANMTAATAAGETGVGQLISQQSNALAQYIMQAMGMDIQGNREMFVTLAQALGQELGAQREMEMARLEREMAEREGAASRKSDLWGALIGGGAALGAGALRGRR